MKFLKGLMTCSLVLLLTGCIGMSKVEYTEMELNSVYLNQHEDKYRNIYEDNSIQIFEERYFNGVLREVEFFAYYIDATEEELKQETLDKGQEIFDKIYQKSKFEITENGDKVVVKIYPIDIITKTLADENIYSTVYEEAYNEATSLDEVEDLYFNKMLDLLNNNINSINYLEPVEIEIEVTNTSGYYEISDDYTEKIDTYIIAY